MTYAMCFFPFHVDRLNLQHRHVTCVPLLDTMAAAEAAPAVFGECCSIGFRLGLESMTIIDLGPAY